MSILRYTASLDNTITNAFEEDLSTRGTGSNMGASDILEVFSIYQQATSASVELSRVLIQFPTASIVSDRAASILPASGSVTWKLKLYNAKHSETVPKSYRLQVSAVSAFWEEGTGLDMEAYSDLTEDNEGSNWLNSRERTSATATIVASTPGSLSNASTFTLTNASGTTTTYRINGGSSGTGTDDYQTQPGGTAGSTIEVYFRLASTVAHVAEAITKAINATTNADMTATNDGTNITITQTTKGTTGNKTNTNNSTGLSSVGNFTGAVGQWTTIGGDYHSDPAPIANTETDFDTGLEDLEVDVSDIVEKWLLSSDPVANYGFGIRLTDAYEGYFSSSTGANTATEIHNLSGAEKSYYTKKFFGRGTEFFFKRPVLEAQFNDTKKDHRGNFTLSSSALPAADNLNRLYCYNYVRGRLIDIAGDNSIQPVVKLYYSSGSVPEGSVRGFRRGSDNVAVTSLSATRESEGVFYIEIAATSSIVTTTYPYLVDVWETPGGEEFFTGSAVTPVKFSPSNEKSRKNYVMSMTNLKEEYQADQTVRLRVYAREKNWSPNIYTTAKSQPENYTIESGSYRLLRVVDDLEVVSYGTGSVKYSGLSYDISGNYFDLDMSLLEPGYQYGFKFSIYDDYTQTYMEQPYLFKFRVIK